MAFMGFPEILIVLLIATGGTGVPLGIPPGEEDPLLAKVAPEECTFYLSWAGIADPDPNSGNHTEQLLAEREVQRFIKNLDQAITAGLISEARGNESRKVVAETAPVLVKAMLTHPGALFVGKASLGVRGVEVDGGLVVSTGEDTDRLKKELARLEGALGPMVQDVDVGGETWKEFPLPENAPRVLWGFRGNYMILGVGEGSVEGMLERVRTAPPKWLTDLREEMTVPRRSTVMYLNVASVLTLSAAGGPQVQTMVEALGLSNVDHLACVTGLDETGFVTRSRVSVNGDPRGVLAIVDGPPLTADDLAPIPKDATFAVAARIDLERVFDQFRNAVGRVDRNALDELERELARLEEETTLKVKEDILEPLGDCWRIYNSPGEGGLLFTGLTAVVSVRDPARVAQTLEKIERKSQEEIPPQDPDSQRRPRHVAVEHFDHNGQKIYFLNSVGEFLPVAVAWTVTDQELIVSLFPSHVKSYLSRGADFESIAGVPQVAEKLAADPGPVMLGYHDTQELFRLWYPIIQFVAQFMCSEAQRSGVDFNMSMLPSAAAISPHLLPSTVTLTKSDGQIELLSHQSVPLSTGPLPLVAPFMFGFGFFVSTRAHEMERAAVAERAAAEQAAAAARDAEAAERETEIREFPAPEGSAPAARPRPPTEAASLRE